MTCGVKQAGFCDAKVNDIRKIGVKGSQVIIIIEMKCQRKMIWAEKNDTNMFSNSATK